MVPPVAVRLRRDFKTVLTLIRAHALLHQASRQKDADGCLKAEIADYAAVRELVADLVAEGADATIKPEVRETVKAVTDLLAGGKAEVMQADIKKALKLDKSAVSRRVTVAVDAGVLRNLEDRKGRPARLVLGDPLPDEIELLPEPERLHGCAVAEGGKLAPRIRGMAAVARIAAGANSPAILCLPPAPTASCFSPIARVSIASGRPRQRRPEMRPRRRVGGLNPQSVRGRNRAWPHAQRIFRPGFPAL